MAAPQDQKTMAGMETLDAEKQTAAHQEFSAEVLDKKGNGDYSGATAKTDPEEIKLVKKLDRWIMVSINIYCINSSNMSSQLFGPCTGSTTSIATPSPSLVSTASRKISAYKEPNTAHPYQSSLSATFWAKYPVT
jgi:hypothetical protein